MPRTLRSCSKADTEIPLRSEKSGNTHNAFFVVGYLVVVFLAMFQRFSLALVNREANDDHYQMIQLLYAGIRSLNMEDCRECFHPKLYYVVCVLVLKVIGATSVDLQIVIAQFLNCIAGGVTLGTIWKALREQRTGRLSLFLTFSWVALNPRLIAINAQVSNDSFAIMFTTLAIYFTYRLLRSGRISHFMFVQFALSCAILSKGTSWTAAIAIVLVLVAAAIFRACSRARFAAFAIICVSVCGLSVKFGNYDFQSYDNYANLGKGKPLYFFKRTIVGRPGVISVADSYLTFRFIDLLCYPINARELELKPMHRSSVWTQLYGRLHCIQFDYHPQSWRTNSEAVKNLNRAIFILALGWLMVAFVGVYSRLADVANGIQKRGFAYFAQTEKFFYIIVTAGYFAFVVYFTYSYRDFAAMKNIYIFPGLLTFAALLQQGLKVTLHSLRSRPVFARMFVLLCYLLFTLYALNVELLIHHLAPKR